MFHHGDGPPLQNEETRNAHIKLNELSGLLRRIRNMLGAVDGGKPEALAYTSDSFYASGLSVLSELKFGLFYLEIYLQQTADALRENEAWQNADEQKE